MNLIPGNYSVMYYFNVMSNNISNNNFSFFESTWYDSPIYNSTYSSNSYPILNDKPVKFDQIHNLGHGYLDYKTQINVTSYKGLYQFDLFKSSSITSWSFELVSLKITLLTLDR